MQINNSANLKEVCTQDVYDEYVKAGTVKDIEEVMSKGCAIPGPSLTAVKTEHIKIYLHDKRGLRTSEANRNHINMLPLITQAAENLGVKYTKLYMQNYLNHSNIYTL
jgi:hypothetical protein